MVRSSENRHVIVSGGSRGLGLGICTALLAAGYKVSTFSRSTTPAIAELAAENPGLWFAEADIIDSENLSRFFQGAVERHGPPYGLVNNAAIVQDGLLATLPEIEIERMIACNLTGALRLSRLAIRAMLAAKDGSIINISSIIGTRGYNGLVVYSATKAGMDGMTRSLAREVGRLGINVNSIAPGYIRTDLSAGLSPGQLSQIVNRTPMRRLAEVEDITPLVLFLLSQEAAFITGQTILIDGGISC